MTFLRPGFVLALSMTLGCTAPRPSATLAPSSSGPRRTNASAPHSEHDSTSAGFEALRHARYDDAEALLNLVLFGRGSRADKLRARRGLAESALARGQVERVLELTSPPPSASLAELELLPLALVRAKGFLDVGRIVEAIQALDFVFDGDLPKKLASQPKVTLLQAQAELLRGQALRELGERAKSEAAFQGAFDQAQTLETGFAKTPEAKPSGALHCETARALAEAAFALGNAARADAAWNEAEARCGPLDVHVLVGRATFLAERHDPRRAHDLLEKALETAPLAPLVLTALAELKLHEMFDFSGAMELAERAITVHSRHPGALAVLAGIALRDQDFAAADRHIALALTQNPRDLPIWSLKAGRYFLSEEPQAFEAAVSKIEQFSPNYADLWVTLAELGDFEHRFREVVDLLRRGLARDRKNARLRAALGLSLSRSGSDAAGLIELQKAFELDPYNRQVYNSLELYEKIVPRDYDEFERGHFRFRFPKAERELLERYVPKLVEQAWRTFAQHYHYEPAAIVSVELYQDRQDFAVRTSGVPEVGLEGVCFGEKIATLSPAGGVRNLGMTLWHEMAHVFHLGLSNNRVPRWLTEGLAEWETERLGRGWAREFDLDLYRGMRAHKIPALRRMNQAFTRAESTADISLAYVAAGRLAAFLMTENEARTVDMLHQLGQRTPWTAVLDRTLGPELEPVEERFLASLHQRLLRFDGQFVSPRLNSPRPPEGAPRCTNTDRVFSVAEVVELLRQENPACALVAEASLVALFQAHPEPDAGLLLAQMLMAQGALERAGEVLDLVFSLGADGAELRLERAKVAAELSELDRAKEELQKALRFDPKCTEAWLLLAQTELRMGRPKAELEALRNLVELEESNAFVHERYLELLVVYKQRAQAGPAADNAIWAGLGRTSTHEAAAKAYRLAGRLQDARFEDETVRLLKSTRSRQPDTAH